MQDRLNQCLCKPYVGTKGKHMTPKKSHVPPSPHVNLCLTKSPISSMYYCSIIVKFIIVYSLISDNAFLHCNK